MGPLTWTEREMCVKHSVLPSCGVPCLVPYNCERCVPSLNTADLLASLLISEHTLKKKKKKDQLGTVFHTILCHPENTEIVDSEQA